MIFEKPSTRTRMSFEAGMHQLGGAAIYLYTRDSQLGRGEPVEDAGQVISRMCDLVMIRTFQQEILSRFAASSRVPDRKSTRLNSSHTVISYAVFCLKKKKKK